MNKIEIKHRYTGEVLLTADADYLRGANLHGANLYGANLCEADLCRADLRRADLRRADLRGADLYGADLTRANLTRANLTRANLGGANLGGANLAEANLGGADLRYCIGNMKEIKSMQIDTWPVVWTKDTMAIGCKQHTIDAWWGFSDKEIAAMDKKAPAWWKKWKPILRQIIEGNRIEEKLV